REGDVRVDLQPLAGFPEQEVELLLRVLLVLPEPVEVAVDRAGVLVVAGRPIEPRLASSHVPLRILLRHSSPGSVLPRSEECEDNGGIQGHASPENSSRSWIMPMKPMPAMPMRTILTTLSAGRRGVAALRLSPGDVSSSVIRRRGGRQPRA